MGDVGIETQSHVRVLSLKKLVNILCIYVYDDALRAAFLNGSIVSNLRIKQMNIHLLIYDHHDHNEICDLDI